MAFRIEHVEEVSSTNDWVRERAHQGEAEGLVIAAEHQTAGRGRGTNQWVSETGENLLFTILLRPSVTAQSLPLVVRLAAEALGKTVEAYIPGAQCRFKHPNDLYLEDRKIAGILVESAVQGQRVDFALLGIGLNVNGKSFLNVPSATSIFLETNRYIEKNEVLDRFIKEFSTIYLAGAQSGQ